jgi:tyrosinase
VIDVATGTVLSVTQLMVRIRKDANTLTPAERDRFVGALATLNDQGLGRFSEFRDMHTNAADEEAHQDAGFLPWHRAYILDLERELQNIDPSVSLPYWRFDRPAPALFSREFLGEADAAGIVRFSPDHPLRFWRTDGVLGIRRLPSFDSLNGNPSVRTELQTLNIGTGFAAFTTMEGNPHASAHLSFSMGYLRSIGTAPRDPLFFLLHGNVDRLWAKWQWLNGRFDFTTASFPFLGSAGTPGATRIGHNLNDSMWPWNGVTGFPRPPTAPGGTFSASQNTSSPGLRPIVREMIDYQGVLNSTSRLGFDYDDVPFEFD